MLRMRLQRRGKTGYAAYRIIVAERGAPVKGRFLADLGWYNPHTNDFVVKKDVVTDWLSKGVQPSATVHNLLVTHGVIKAEKVTSWKPKKKEADASAAAGPAAAPATSPSPETTADQAKPAETPSELSAEPTTES